MRILIALALSATPAIADYSGHKSMTPFTEGPCSEVLDAIDTPETSIEAIARMGMAWGFILGYDAASDGLHGQEETTLIRLRKACDENPETPAATLLDGFR